jgi:enoyl-CoA hydratase
MSLSNNSREELMQEYKSFKVEVQGHVAHIQLNRPEQMNSMTKEFWCELPRCVQSLDAEGLVRVIVVSSTGKHFCSGMDLGVFSDPACMPTKGDAARMAENLRRLVMQLQDSLSALENVRIPVLTAIQGGCIGGALDMVCASDSRYCTDDAFFTIKETQIGMTADVGTLQRLPKLIPEGIVRELAYTGRNFSAHEALQFGLVNKVFESHEAMIDGVMSIAAQIAKNSPLAVLGCKEMINYSRDHSVADSLKYMATWQSGMFRQEELMKSFAAKAQKVEPKFDAVWPAKDLFE